MAHELGLSNEERDILAGEISLATMGGQMIGSLLSGFIVDKYSRKNMLVYFLLLGSLAMNLFGLIHIYRVLLFLRIVTGGCQGAIVPIIFSLIGDFYSAAEGRATTSAIVSSCLGGGMMIGQLFVGYFLEIFYNWDPYINLVMDDFQFLNLVPGTSIFQKKI